MGFVLQRICVAINFTRTKTGPGENGPSTCDLLASVCGNITANRLAVKKRRRSNVQQWGTDPNLVSDVHVLFLFWFVWFDVFLVLLLYIYC